MHAATRRIPLSIGKRRPSCRGWYSGDLRVDVILNGKVIGGQATSIVLIPETGWQAVRSIGPAAETIRYAHSSPFYFTKDGKLPVKKAESAR